jgi:hypothetical protein
MYVSRVASVTLFLGCVLVQAIHKVIAPTHIDILMQASNLTAQKYKQSRKGTLAKANNTFLSTFAQKLLRTADGFVAREESSIMASVTAVQRRLEAVQRREERLSRSHGLTLNPFSSDPASSQPDGAAATHEEESGVKRALEWLQEVQARHWCKLVVGSGYLWCL